jgi:hypothetical protein
MALANLNINLTANVSNVVNAMADVKAVTHASMIGSSTAVNDFQRNFSKDAAAISEKSNAMSKDMETTGAAISSSADLSAKSFEEVSAAANASLAGVKELSKGMDVAGAKMKDALGPEISEQVKSTTDRVEEFVATRVAIAAVGIALGAVAATVVAVGVAAYKASGFLKGLITGESYKSENIEYLIKTNDAVVELQKNLNIAAQDATAMNDALQRKGVNKSDIISVNGSVDTKMHGDKSELDRLGVAYKDINGEILENARIVQNAKDKLDEFTPGWDRNAAAVAMGFGTYEQINNYLQINQKELQQSKERLDEYGLGIGVDTQAAVGRYQAAMLAFNNETRLMSEGVKRVIADNVMPILTNFAGYLQDGWPVAVNFFRGVTWAFSSILSGLDSSAYIAIKGTMATLVSFVDVTEGVVLAIGKLATGDVKGAMGELAKGWSAGEKTIGDATAKIVEHAKNTQAALLSGIGYDDRTNPLGAKPPAGRKFEPPPAAETIVKSITGGLTDEQKAAQQQIKQFLKTVWDDAALELATEDFGSDITKKLGMLTPKPTGFTKVPKLDLGTSKLKSIEEQQAEAKVLESIQMAQIENQISLLNIAEKYNQVSTGDAAQARITLLKSELEIQQAKYERSKGDELLQLHQIALITAINDKILEQQKILRDTTAIGGMKSALEDYAKTATNTGAQIKSVMSNAIKGMEDALTDFVQTGKINFKSLTDSIISDIIRMMIQKSLSGVFGNGSSGSGIGGMIVSGIGSLISGAKASGGPVGGGQTYLVGEKGPELFTPGASGSITPNNALGSNVNMTVNVINQTGQQVKTKDGGTKFDGSGMVKTIILEAMDSDPGFRWAMRGNA